MITPLISISPLLVTTFLQTAFVSKINPLEPRTNLAKVEFSFPNEKEKVELQVPNAITADLKVGEKIASNQIQKIVNNFETQLKLETKPGTAGTQESIDLGFLRSLRPDLKFQQTGDTREGELYLPLYKLHCPKVKGCKAKYVNRTDSTESIELKVEFLGIGGGNGEEVEISNLQECEISEACMEERVKAKLRIRPGNLLSGNRRIFSMIRVDISDVDKNRTRPRKIPKKEDSCGLSSSKIRKLEQQGKLVAGFSDLTNFKKNQISVTTSNGIYHNLTESFTFNIPFDILGSVASLGLETKRTLSNQVDVSCTLVGGKKYHWYGAGNGAQNRSMECFWA